MSLACFWSGSSASRCSRPSPTSGWYPVSAIFLTPSYGGIAVLTGSGPAGPATIQAASAPRRLRSRSSCLDSSTAFATSASTSTCSCRAASGTSSAASRPPLLRRCCASRNAKTTTATAWPWRSRHVRLPIPSSCVAELLVSSPRYASSFRHKRETTKLSSYQWNRMLITFVPDKVW